VGVCGDGICHEALSGFHITFLHSVRVRALLLVLLVALLAALASSDAVYAAVVRLFEATRGMIDQHSMLGPVMFVLLAAVSAMLAFFSSAVLVPAAVYAWGPVVSALLLWVGWMLGGIAAYTLASRLGRPALGWVARGRSLERYEKRFSTGTPFGVVLLFQLALPSEIPGYVLGLARYPLGRYLAALAIAELPYAVGTVLLGASFVARRVGSLVSLGAAAALAALLLGRALHRRMGDARAGGGA
jgi:uncharacterized membrane protein YdjX (TVP38/TMEM64 family)